MFLSSSICSIICIFAAVAAVKFGNFEAIVKALGKCDDEGSKLIYVDNYKLRMTKRHGIPVYNAVLTAIQPIDDNLELKIVDAIWGKTGGWKNNAWVKNLGGACQAFKTFMPDLWKSLLKSINVKSCPIGPGNFTVKDLELKVKFGIPYARYGKYRVDLNFMKNKGLKVGCFRSEVDVVPKKT